MLWSTPQNFGKQVSLKQNSSARHLWRPADNSDLSEMYKLYTYTLNTTISF